MSLSTPSNVRGPILDLTLPASAEAVDIMLRNKTTGDKLRLKLPAGWAGDDLTLDFYRRTIKNQAGVDRSALLDSVDNSLWTPEPLVSGANNIAIDVRLPSPAQLVNVEIGQIVDLAIDGTFIYWADISESGRIGRSLLSGASSSPSFVLNPSKPVSLAVDATYLYWADEGLQTIGRCKLNGTEVKTEFILSNTPYAVAVDGTYIYWIGYSAPNYVIGRAKLGGTEVNKTWVTIGPDYSPTDLKVTAGYIYWTGAGDKGRIGRCKISGTEVLPEWFVAAGEAQPGSLALDANFFYLGDQEQGVCRAPFAAPEHEDKVIYASTWTAADGVEVNATHAYFTKASNQGYIGRAPLYSNYAATATLRWEKGYF